MKTVPLLANALERAGFEAPVAGTLARLIAGDLPLEEWIAVVRTTIPTNARRQRRAGFWRRVRDWLRRVTHPFGRS